MARSGIDRIDRLFEGQPAEAIAAGDAYREAVGAAQDLLIGHGFKKLPGLLAPDRGRFGPRTTAAVAQFQQDHNLDESGTVDGATLQRLVEVPAVNPLASRPYLTLALDFVFTGMVRLMGLTTAFEGAGLFSALNRNRDRAGLSLGDRKSTRLNSSHSRASRMPSSA